MRHLDLFSGIGGFALAARWMGWQTVGFCETDEWCQRVLAKNFPGVPIHGDIKTLMAYPHERRRPTEKQDIRRRESNAFGGSNGAISDGIDIITAGFPCQPYSLAGQRRGAGDDRALGHEAVRLIDQCRPRYAVLENVYGFVSMGLNNLLSDLENIGYRVGAFVIPACAVDAPHRRDRVWIIAAHADSDIEPDGAVNAGAFGGMVSHHDSDALRQEQESMRRSGNTAKPAHAGETVANADEQGPQGHGRLRQRAGECAIGSSGEAVKAEWLPEPRVGRVAHGVPRRVDRLRGLGNAIVPQVAYQIFKAIADQHEEQQ